MDQRIPEDGGKLLNAGLTPKIGFAQAITFYGDRWRAGLSVSHNLSGRHSAAHGIRHRSVTESSLQQDMIIMRYRALREMALALDASEAGNTDQNV